jgi:hypothetical protein
MSASSNLGLGYAEGDQVANARLNATMVMSAKGSEIASVPFTQQTPLFRCLESTSGFIANELYMRTADNLGVTNVRRKHTHSADTDEEGGLLHNMFIYNPRIVQFGLTPFNNLYDFNQTKVNTASFDYVPDEFYGRTLLLTSTWDTAGSIGNYVNASVAGQQIGFTEKMLAMATLYMDFNANQVARVGFGMELANNTVDVTRKVGMEMCGGTGTNWQAVSANGVTRTVSATSMNSAPVPNAFMTYRFFFNPNTVSYKLTNTDGLTKVMTSTIPSGGSIDYPRLFRFGLDTTNSTTKHMWLLRLYFIAKNTDPSWFNGPE